MKLVYKYTSDIINVEYKQLITKTVFKNFKKIHPRKRHPSSFEVHFDDYDIVFADIITEGNTIVKVMFVKGAEDKDHYFIDFNTIDSNYICSVNQEYNTISCDNCGKTYLYNINKEVKDGDFLGCYCCDQDRNLFLNDTECDDNDIYIFIRNKDIYIEYSVYTY